MSRGPLDRADARGLRAAIAFVWLTGCAADPAPLPPGLVGNPGSQFHAADDPNLFWVETSLNGGPTRLVIADTGAPIVLLDTEAFDGAVPAGSGQVARMSLGGTVLSKVPTVGIRGQGELAPDGQPFGGIVGYTAFADFAVTFDYRQKQLVLGAASLPDGLVPAVSVPFSLEGGGFAQLPNDDSEISFPPSRIIIAGELEGHPLTFVLDTGASWMAVTTGFFDQITADGRGTVTVDAGLAGGETSAELARMRALSVAGLEVDDTVAVAGSRIDDLLDTLGREVGHAVDGLLGAPFLRHFFVTVDYPNTRVDFRRYADESFIVDDYRKVGIDLREATAAKGSAFVVARVYPGTDAEQQGIADGAELLTVDGEALAGLSLAAAQRKLLGPVHSLHRLVFADRTIDVAVDDLLPLP